jgi:hypothetical protein
MFFFCGSRCGTKCEDPENRVKIDTSDQTNEFVVLSSQARFVEAKENKTEEKRDLWIARDFFDEAITRSVIETPAPSAEPQFTKEERQNDLKANLKERVAAFSRSLRQGVKVQQASDGAEVTLSLDTQLMNLTVERPEIKSVQFALARTEVLHGNEPSKGSPTKGSPTKGSPTRKKTTATDLDYQQVVLVAVQGHYCLQFADQKEAQNFYTCLTILCVAAKHRPT